MAKKIIKARMTQRRDTADGWAAANPILLDGELGIVTDDKNLYKIGDGVTPWNGLPFRGFDGTLVHETGASRNAVMSQDATTRALGTKQNVIEDLETIRSGAAKGATALQEHQDISHLATKTELEATKAELRKLQSDAVKMSQDIKTLQQEVIELRKIIEERPSETSNILGTAKVGYAVLS